MVTKKELLKWYDEDYCLEAVKQNLNVIKYVDIKRFPKVYEFLTI